MDYNLPNIRKLLNDGFTAEQLRRFCYDHSDFRAVYDALASSTGKADIIDQLIEHTERMLLFDALLSWAQQTNPARYKMHGPYTNTATPHPSEPKSHAPNPFTATLAIDQPECFIGRQGELRRLQAMLQSSSVVVLGAPKIGKSSLLRQLRRVTQMRVAGPIDCHAVEDRNDYYAELSEAIGLPHDSSWRQIRGALRQFEGLLLVDELSAGPDRGITVNDMALLRSVCGDNPRLRLVVASRVPLKTVYPDTGTDSPAYNFLQPLRLGPLTDAEAQTLLTHRWAATAPPLAPAEIAVVLALTGRHPFKLQRAAFHCYEALTQPGYDWQAQYHYDMEHML